MTPADVDKIISAEIPDIDTDPELYEDVTSYNIHGPCGTDYNPTCSCMHEGECIHHFPRNFRENTEIGDNSYALYRRRDNGIKITIKSKSRTYTNIDNRWVVPYSPLLMRLWKGHCNVEMCASVKSVKYLFKYIGKGPDRAQTETLSADDKCDERKVYQTGRCISPEEACHRLFNYNITHITPPVLRLAIHLPQEQTIYFSSDNTLENEQQACKTTLTEYFKLNKIKDEISKTLLYHEIPEHYTWDKSQKNGNLGNDKLIK